MLVPDKRAALYTTEVVETDGERERVTTASRFNMPSVFKLFCKSVEASCGTRICTLHQYYEEDGFTVLALGDSCQQLHQCLPWRCRYSSFAKHSCLCSCSRFWSSKFRCSFKHVTNNRSSSSSSIEENLCRSLGYHFQAQMVFCFRCQGTGVILRIFSMRENKYDLQEIFDLRIY